MTFEHLRVFVFIFVFPSFMVFNKKNYVNTHVNYIYLSGKQ
jgi:hypothetical protein